ncbi:hypothetical protein EDC01DRAFT_633667 [Geopyxis carbonaria]|nr:hypothetical protein EDC01DRAFT_633667 [Geopyxis carbonaria]
MLLRQQYSASDLGTALGKRKRLSHSSDNPWVLAAGARSTSARLTQENIGRGTALDPKTYREHLTRFLVDCNLPLHTVENQSFRDLVRYCNPDVPEISRMTAAEDVQQLYKEMLPPWEIPAKGLPAERLFSRSAGDVVAKKRNGLLEQATTATAGLVKSRMSLPDTESRCEVEAEMEAADEELCV